jgi:hypothetical protein
VSLRTCMGRATDSALAGIMRRPCHFCGLSASDRSGDGAHDPEKVAVWSLTRSNGGSIITWGETMTYHDASEKPADSISVKTFLENVKAGVNDAELMQKHDLSVSGLWRVFDKLVTTGILEAAELDEHRMRTASYAWKCPLCGTPKTRKVLRCPNCGIAP